METTQFLFVLSALCFAADAIKGMVSQPRKMNLTSAGLCLFTITIALA